MVRTGESGLEESPRLIVSLLSNPPGLMFFFLFASYAFISSLYYLLTFMRGTAGNFGVPGFLCIFRADLFTHDTMSPGYPFIFCYLLTFSLPRFGSIVAN